MLEGGGNTRYFQLKASGRKRKGRILSLKQDEGLIEDEVMIRTYITAFYKNLFGPKEDTSISMSSPQEERLSEEENDLLTQPFTMEEIRDVVFQMEHNKNPYGFPIKFYRFFWDTIKPDLKALFHDFHAR